MAPAPLGAVLTGGRSARFGAPKALVELEGRALSVRVAEALRAGGCAPVIAVGEPVGAPPGALARLWEAAGLRAPAPLAVPVPDAWPGQGPLAAVLTALRLVGDSPGVLTAACDLAWLDPVAVRLLRGPLGDPSVGVGAASHVVRHGVCGGDLVPLIWWPRAVAGRVEELLATGERSLRGALRTLGSQAVEVDARSARDVDLPSDLPAGL